MSKLFIPITKIDTDQHVVEGYASTPELDRQGDRVSLDAIKAALPDYMRFPTIREMHQPMAAGRTVSATVDDQGLYIRAKVVDDAAWKKVKEKVYNGFSIGGNATGRDDEWITALELIEISLVDSPANVSAVFQVWKREGGPLTEGEKPMLNLKKFGGPENGTEEDVEKLIKVSTDKAIEEVSRDNTSLRKQLAEVKSTAGDALALQAENEALKKNISDRDEKEQAAQMKKILDGAIKAGKIEAAARPKWEKRFKVLGAADCEDVLKNMPVTVPMNERLGAGGADDETIGDQVKKVIREIMVQDKCSEDVAIAKAYKTHSKLMKARDNAQLALSRHGGSMYGGDSEV